jgi:glycosyltransferase involved in cell wall biosynthesis
MRPLTIGIEATLAGVRGAERHGIYRYLQQLLLGFRAVGGPHRFRLWFNGLHADKGDTIPRFLAEVGGPQVEAKVCRFPVRLRQWLNMPAEWFTGPIDLFHGPSHLLPYLRAVRTVVTIHDLAFLRMTEPLGQRRPDWVAAIQRRSPQPGADLAAYRARCAFFLGLQRQVPATLARADAIVADSEATARDLVELAGVPRSKVRVVLCGVTPWFAPVRDDALMQHTLASLGIEGRYVLYVGVLDPNKDLHTLITGFAQTSAQFRREHQLIITGPRNWFQAVLEEEADRLGVGDRVRFLGYVLDPTLPVLYSGATVAVSPSPLEGFGIPVPEAMACGTPVVVVDAGALPEVAGEAALRVPPHNPAAMAEAIERVASDSDLAAELIARGFTRCRAFSWERAAAMTLAVYAEVAG